MKDRIYLSKTSSITSIDNNFIEGESISRFEKSLEVYFENKKHIVALNSGTSAIHLALILSGVTEGDEVLCQSFTFVATANPILYQKANPIFIDSELDTQNMCPYYLEEAIKSRIEAGKKPKAIILVHLYGMPAKIDEIASIAKKYDIILIEDAAEALGSHYKEQKCGTFGNFGILSFNNNKIITTFGGGALICNTLKEKDKAVFLATQSKDKAVHYQHSEIGFNYRMSPFLAEIGNEQLSKLEEKIQKHRDNNLFYQTLFKEIKGVTLLKEFNLDWFSNHWLTCIFIDNNIANFTSDDLRIELEKDNIEARPQWKPMHLQPLFKDSIYFGGNNAEVLFKKGLCLPSGSCLSREEKERIKKSILKVIPQK
ncbi:DegT/DnrJ/EryC1/StrS family aminotransferase [Polaribacter sargassicola]|uniref:DegT/DnrJ/EryC1/StrS family aminotransferase n=1 Tax=Polaribacter sargassicola TaxID=2836891 RepID=UPI001F42C758|nr:DegT/DnrJ/EryC1/StrS family aminotransferase [Polaribacter sp. DS7-9]MCG1036549.1 DegT/DnrJ/EryC1/StrS family aminotransferase [Polaribacter sp. DS7-9]